MNEHTPDPTPEEIRRECERIQETWSEDERARRRGGIPKEKRPLLMVPFVKVGELASS